MIAPDGYKPDTEVKCSSGDQCLAKSARHRFPNAPILPLREFRLSNRETERRRASFTNQCRHCQNGGVISYDVPAPGFFRCTSGSDCVTGDPVQRGEGVGLGYAPINPAGNRTCASCVAAKRTLEPATDRSRPPSVDDRRLYVYAWLCLDTFSWEYVGKGRGSRCLAHHNRPGVRPTEKAVFTHFCGTGPVAEGIYTELEAAVFSALYTEHGGDKTLTNRIDLRQMPIRPAVYRRGLEIADKWADRAAALYRLERAIAG